MTRNLNDESRNEHIKEYNEGNEFSSFDLRALLRTDGFCELRVTGRTHGKGASG